MSDEIVVKVNSYGAGRALSLVYFDPTSGKKVAKSSGTTDWREAERQAGELQRELRAGRYVQASKVTWGQFIERYTEEKLATLRPKSRKSALESLGKLNYLFHPDKLAKVNAALLSRFQAELRKPRKVTRGDKEITLPPIRDTAIAHHLRAIKAALRWAERQGMLAKAPLVEMPKGAKGRKMKGGAVLGEQFERMLAGVPKVRPKDSAEWVHYLTGLYLSGLRLTESVDLSWDDNAPFAVDLSGRHPRFRIKGEAQKSGQDELLPMTPDFAEFLLQTPEAERVGPVFKLNEVETGTPITAHSVGKLVGEIGERALVVVNSVDRKTASAHDLRRSFATRWASKVKPATLQRLMRHASIQTTMGYYVDLDVDEMADELWATHKPGDTTILGNNSGNIAPDGAENETREPAEESTESLGSKEFPLTI